MRFDNEDEKKAFEFVCKLAEKATDRICNDLEKEDYNNFNHLVVESSDEKGKKFMRTVCYDFDVIFWLKAQEGDKK